MSETRPTRSRAYSAPRQDTMADILERVLDTGVVIAGDIRVQLADIELLTIQIRLVICSVDKAQEMGMDWWRSASFLSTGAIGTDQVTDASRLLEAERAERRLEAELHRRQMQALDARLERLERAIEALATFATGGDR